MKHRITCIALIAATTVAAPAFAAVGDQLTATTTLASDALAIDSQGAQAIAMGIDGQTIVVWKAQLYGETILLSRRFDAHGNPVGSFPFELNQTLTEGEVIGDPVVTIDDNNVATLVWQSTSPGDGGDIRLIRIGNDGFPIGPVLTVNTDIDGTQSLPSVASDRLNHVLVTWTGPLSKGGHGLFGQLYNGFGSTQFAQFRIDPVASSAPVRSVAVMGECCTPVAVWQAEGLAPFEKTLLARSIGLSGEAFGDAVVVNQQVIVSDDAIRFAADTDTDRNITVAWIDPNGLWLQRLDSSLNLIGAQSPVNAALPVSADSGLFLQMGHQGRGLLAWSDTESFPNRGVVQAIDAGGATGVSIDVLTSDAAFSKRIGGLAADQDGDAGITWLSSQFPGAALRSINFARFEGTSDVAAALSLRSNALILPADNFTVDIEVVNQAMPMTYSPAINTLTGVRVEVDLDDRLSIVQDPSSQQWQCQVGDPVVCVHTAVIAPAAWNGSNVIPLLVSAPNRRATLINTALLTSLQGDFNRADNVVTQSIEVGDGVPDAFSFNTRLGVMRLSVQTSEEALLSGFDVPQSLSVSEGEYSINGAAFTTAPTIVHAGDLLRLRHLAHAEFNRRVTTFVNVGDVNVGGIQSGFATQTELGDTTPDAFAFLDASGVPLGSLQVSKPIIVTGINSAAAISVSGGEYSIDGGLFAATPGTVVAGASVRVRHVASSAFNGNTDTTLSIGGISDTFRSTTEAMDITPNNFSIADQIGLATFAVATSAPTTISGINAPTQISIIGGVYSINGAAFTATVSSVNDGAHIRVALTTASNASTAADATLTIGGVSDVFSATTGTTDTTPAAFTFRDVSGVRKGSLITSDPINVTSINAPVTISVNGHGVQWAKNSGAFTANAGTVVNGDQVRLRMSASSNSNTKLTATATIGSISDQWSVTTGR